MSMAPILGAGGAATIAATRSDTRWVAARDDDGNSSHAAAPAPAPAAGGLVPAADC